jgi:hypothetical protein
MKAEVRQAIENFLWVAECEDRRERLPRPDEPMAPQDSFGLLRTILRARGLSPGAVDDIVARILDLLGSRDDTSAPADHPYHLRDEFLSPAIGWQVKTTG